MAYIIFKVDKIRKLSYLEQMVCDAFERIYDKVIYTW